MDCLGLRELWIGWPYRQWSRHWKSTCLSQPAARPNGFVNVKPKTSVRRMGSSGTRSTGVSRFLPSQIVSSCDLSASRFRSAGQTMLLYAAVPIRSLRSPETLISWISYDAIPHNSITKLRINAYRHKDEEKMLFQHLPRVQKHRQAKHRASAWTFSGKLFDQMSRRDQCVTLGCSTANCAFLLRFDSRAAIPRLG